MNTIRYLIYGKVQGVAFRYHTKQEADRLGIQGLVKNLADGSVECCISAGQKNLDKFEAFLQEGPRWANVSRVEKLESAVPLTNKGFIISY